MILGRYLLTALRLEFYFFDYFIVGDEGPYEGCSEPMVDVSNYDYTYLTDKIIKPEESLFNSYINECLE